MKRLILSLACFGFVANAHAVEVLSSIKLFSSLLKRSPKTQQSLMR
ncbi:hypothetical protein JCM19231_2940 [Vibrio ishigakensis]|uniref:Uncharacterized protein n=1 Tax=Vibrio ishigakensis TaxID=1481914 RepID=A0A0B8NWV1_9VIBR|nr:hypothetical protein JCM19231_2940 [Vibrio ishigakensis]